jgi:mannose-6-phosphate isomerase-like protein (cupin superfamily)
MDSRSDDGKISRREIAAFLPLLAAATAFAPEAAAAPATELEALKSGAYPEGPASGAQQPVRTSRHFLLGILPDNIRLEAHTTTLAPGAGPEPVEHHKHSEMWFVREGAVALMTNGVTRTLKSGDMGLCVAGDNHSVANASNTEPCSYFVVAVGPPE